MPTAAISVVVFDAYGTLFDVGSAARRFAESVGQERSQERSLDATPAATRFAARWSEIAEAWRRKQLEYSWLRAIDGRHVDFQRVTEDALAWSLDWADCADDALAARLMDLYRTLSAYPEARAAIEALQSRGKRLAILSNGAPAMLDAAVRAAQFDRLFDAVMSVESVGVFKPSPDVYALAPEYFGCARDEVCFVSSNGWDVCSAAAFGFRTVWVNRRGEPVDRLGAEPDVIAPDLSALPAQVDAFDAAYEKDN